MSDTGRKGVTDQVEEKVTPDSQKSYLDQASETVSGLGDKAAGAVQPGDSKSTTQKLSDSTRSGADDAQNTSGSYLDSAKDSASGLASSASDTLSGAADKVSGSK
ncbi:hypothetical protein MMC20_005549 [Loxospora ochrophaea]|nr:hypothetical protein [Loxospora ochrophaea]